MSLLFTDISMRVGSTLVTYGTKRDVCLFTYREMMNGKTTSEAVEVRRELEGNLEGKPVVKFLHSGSEVVISMAYIHRLSDAQRQRDKERNAANEVEE